MWLVYTVNLQSVCHVVVDDLNPKKYELAVQSEFPLELTEWDKEPYANGVQDLPQHVKSILRLGGKAEMVIDANMRIPFVWKSSNDLT